MKKPALFLAAVFAVSHPAFGQCTNNPLKQWLLPPCPNLMDALSKGIDEGAVLDEEGSQRAAVIGFPRGGKTIKRGLDLG